MDKCNIKKSKSVSVLLKQKINLAFGKPSQSTKKPTSNATLNNSNSKTSLQRKAHSFYGKQRSNSFTSLPKSRLNSTSEQLQISIKQKLNMFEMQTPSKSHPSSLISVTETRVTSSSKDKTKAQSSIKFPLNQSLIWIDSKNRKLKFIDKNVQTLGDDSHESYRQLWIQKQSNDHKDQLLFTISNDNICIGNKEGIHCSKYDLKEGKIHELQEKDLKKSFSFKFDGYLFLTDYKKPTSIKDDKTLLFSFMIDQINQLYSDGLKDFNIISSIAKRMFEQRYPRRDLKQDYFILLIRFQCPLSTSHKNTQKKRVLDTQRLISHKLYCMQQVTMQKLSTKQPSYNPSAYKAIKKK